MNDNVALVVIIGTFLISAVWIEIAMQLTIKFWRVNGEKKTKC